MGSNVNQWPLWSPGSWWMRIKGGFTIDSSKSFHQKENDLRPSLALQNYWNDKWFYLCHAVANNKSELSSCKSWDLFTWCLIDVIFGRPISNMILHGGVYFCNNSLHSFISFICLHSGRLCLVTGPSSSALAQTLACTYTYSLCLSRSVILIHWAMVATGPAFHPPPLYVTLLSYSSYDNGWGSLGGPIEIKRTKGLKKLRHI